MTREQLAELKRLPIEVLDRFGVVQAGEVVLLRYVDAHGAPARSRIRTGLRGVDGTAWDPGSADLPVVPYFPPAARDLAASTKELVVVEGESDCWVAAQYGIAAAGIPGSDRWGCIRRDDLAGVERLFIVWEDDDPRTYPDGFDAYARGIAPHVEGLGWHGEVRRVDLPDGISDLSDLHLSEDVDFADGWAAAVAGSRPL